MSSSTHAAFIERQTERWKARAQAKQKWLERALAAPTKSSADAKWREQWIKDALTAVKRGQVELQYRAGLTDIYAGHLSVLEMTLMAAAEQEPKSATKT